VTDWETRFAQKPRRTALNVGVSVIAIVAVLGVVGSAIGLITLPFRTATGVLERTAQPDNVIANYEWFKRQYQDVRAIDVRLEASRRAATAFETSAGARTGWTFEDKQESARLNSVILGLEGQRASMVAEYNARTQMMNRDIFRTSDLPAEIR
jgi:hypothetical protein